MKKWLGFLVVFLLSFALVSCGMEALPVTTEQTIETVSEVLRSLETENTEETSDAKEEDSERIGEGKENVDRDFESDTEEDTEGESSLENEEFNLTEDGIYSSKDDVARYLYLYGHLPSNFITKKEAEKLGWKGGSLEPFAPGMCIGGSRFGNYEGLLPEKEGRFYTECDIDTLGADKRGAKRIVFSNDGLIYYTEDHYESFELLYGDE